MSRLSDLTWTALAALPLREMILAVPIGSTEQHGSHLPLSTDTDITEELVTRLSEERPDVLVAPTIPVGASGEHQGFPGTLSIGLEATELVLVELVRSAALFIDHVLIVSAHGGNREAIQTAITTLRAEGRDVMAWSPRYPAGDAHAGYWETSIELTLRKELVAGDGRPGNTAPLPELIDDLRRLGVKPLSPTGVLGDPTGASADAGARVLRLLGDDLSAVVSSWRPIVQAVQGSQMPRSDLRDRSGG